jgi:hypothetical protein
MTRLLAFLLLFVVFALVAHAIWLHRDAQRMRSMVVAAVAAGLVVVGVLMVVRG